MALICDILFLTDIENSQTSLKERDFSLSTLVSDVENLIFMEGENTRYALETHIDRTLPDMLYGDSGKLRQVLINLLSNARKFAGKGQISLRVILLENENSSHANSTPNSQDQEEKVRVCFEVEDEGVGIPKANQTLIFERFCQLDDSLNRRFSGSGLGLSISRELVKLLGGELSVESPSKRSGCGSVFRFDIPLAVGIEVPSEQAAIPIDEYLEALKKISSQKKLLLVEDNPVNQQIALAMLAKADLKADVAENGQLALEALDKNTYALVLMDLQMPVMDGLSATRHMRSNTAYSTLPIVALTAQVLEGDRERCLEAGMNDYVPKPIKPESLYKTLHHFLCR